MRVTIAAIALAVAGGLAMTGCGQATPTATAEGPGGLLVVPEGLRPDAPEIRGTTLDGRSFDLADLRGQTVLLNAYASWCPPCLAELPVLAAADRTLPDFSVVGIDVADQAEAGRGVLAAVGATYPALEDPRGALVSAFTNAPTRGLPFSILIDPQGRVAGRVIGPATEQMLGDAARQIN